VNEAKRLRALEDENRQLKRLVADQALNLQVVKDLLGKKVGSSQRRAVVAWARTAYQVGERRACRALAMHRAMIRYESVKPDDARCAAAWAYARGISVSCARRD
jgi:putative transposase